MKKEGTGKRLTAAAYYRNLFQVFSNSFNPILRCGKLMAEFACNCWYKVENQRLTWHKFHQKELRAEKYQGLVDAMRANENVTEAGDRIILASSHTGSPRWYRSKFQDSMAIVRKFGKPHLFVTFTASGQWDETKECIYDGQDPVQRPDMVVRIFNAKLHEFKKDVLKNNVLGKVIAYSYVIEFQKRGLPHVHMVLWLDPSDAPRKPEDVDRFTCAEIPDPVTSPKLHALVQKHMVHGPCKGICQPGSGPPCLKNNECDKGFPKDISKHTIFANAASPLYRRRSPNDGGHLVNVYSSKTKQNHTLNNKWVVPYNR